MPSIHNIGNCCGSKLETKCAATDNETWIDIASCSAVVNQFVVEAERTTTPFSIKLRTGE